MSIPIGSFYSSKRNKLNGGNSASLNALNNYVNLNNNNNNREDKFFSPATKRYHHDQYSSSYYNPLHGFQKKRSPIKKLQYKNDQFLRNNKRKYNNENRQKDQRDLPTPMKKSRSNSEENFRKHNNSNNNTNVNYNDNNSPSNSIRSRNLEEENESPNKYNQNRNPFSLNNNNQSVNQLFKDKTSSYRNKSVTIEEVQQSYDSYISKIDSLYPVALRNLGNTCYMNAIVQTLFNLPTLIAEIRHSMEKAILKNSKLPFTMTKGIMDLFEEYKHLRKTQSTNDEELERRLCAFKNNVSINHVEFKSSGQHDAVEFLDAVINSIDDEYNKVKKILPDCENPIDKVFKIVYGEQSVCENCGTKSNMIKTGQHCLILSLPEEKLIKEDLNLQDLLNNYFKTEKRESKCEKCDSKERTTHMKVIKSPRVLILQLGRYTSANDKRHEQINVPENIILPKVLKLRKDRTTVKVNNSITEIAKTITLADDDQQPSTSKSGFSFSLEDNQFELNGVICHHGSCVAGGHYVCYVYDRLMNQWYQCDDENISQVDFKKVYEGSKSSGYCFFYLNKNFL